MEESKKGQRLMETRRMVHDEIERFVRAMEQKITEVGLTPFEVGFIAIRGRSDDNDYTCTWDMGLTYLWREESEMGKQPLKWINDASVADYPHIRTNEDGLQQSSVIGAEIGLQVDALKYLHNAFTDEIWPDLDEHTQEEFSRMCILFDNCISKLEDHQKEVEQMPSIVHRNHQRIALGIDKEEAA